MEFLLDEPSYQLLTTLTQPLQRTTQLIASRDVREINPKIREFYPVLVNPSYDFRELVAAFFRSQTYTKHFVGIIGTKTFQGPAYISEINSNHRVAYISSTGVLLDVYSILVGRVCLSVPIYSCRFGFVFEPMQLTLTDLNGQTNIPKHFMTFSHPTREAVIQSRQLTQ